MDEGGGDRGAGQGSCYCGGGGDGDWKPSVRAAVSVGRQWAARGDAVGREGGIGALGEPPAGMHGKIFGTTLAGLELDSWILSMDQTFNVHVPCRYPATWNSSTTPAGMFRVV